MKESFIFVSISIGMEQCERVNDEVTGSLGNGRSEFGDDAAALGTLFAACVMSPFYKN